MKIRLRSTLIVLVVALLLLIILACYIVWPPDVLARRENILSEVTCLDGHKLLVVQKWNGIDFYTTYLKHKSPGGKTESSFVVDPDDRKRWRCELRVDELNQEAKVVLGGHVIGTLHIATNIFVRSDGQAVAPHETKQP
jgi:hypothetical protein